MTRRLFELCGADPAQRFSPFAWRIRMALAHKGLEAEFVPWRFTDKQAIAHAGSIRVPVLEDGDTVLADSWQIAQYLDATYPEAPLFRGIDEARLFVFWVETAVMPTLLPGILEGLFDSLHEKDRTYFRESREKRFGRRLEEVYLDLATARDHVGGILTPARMKLAESPFLGGEAPLYVDYALFGALQWARVSSPHELLPDPADPMRQWRERMLDLYDGLGRGVVHPAAA